jgi:hypothetical protein
MTKRVAASSSSSNCFSLDSLPMDILLEIVSHWRGRILKRLTRLCFVCRGMRRLFLEYISEESICHTLLKPYTNEKLSRRKILSFLDNNGHYHPTYGQIFKLLRLSNFHTNYQKIILDKPLEITTLFKFFDGVESQLSPSLSHMVAPFLSYFRNNLMKLSTLERLDLLLDFYLLRVTTVESPIPCGDVLGKGRFGSVEFSHEPGF